MRPFAVLFLLIAAAAAFADVGSPCDPTGQRWLGGPLPRTALAPKAVSGQGQPAAAPPPSSIAAPAIPGVITADTRVELVGVLRRTEGPVAMPDGSLLVSDADRITKIDSAGRISTFVEPSGGANAVSFDSKGRLISVERAANNEKVGVLYPSRATLVD